MLAIPNESMLAVRHTNAFNLIEALTSGLTLGVTTHPQLFESGGDALNSKSRKTY